MSSLQSMFLNAQGHLVGGATAGGRYHAVYGQPVYLDHASGSHLFDVEGHDYIDFHTSAGAAFFGYNHPRLKAAAEKAIEMGFFMNFETKYHKELADLLCAIFPSAEMIRLANSGTEATLAAIRLARGYTGKDLVIRFEGHFHGMHELIWYNHNAAGKMDEIGEIENIPDTAGMPNAFSAVVKNVEFNDIDALRRVVKRHSGHIATIILEPISFNCGCYPAYKEYLQQVRKLCDQEGIVLIFDEVISGLRMRPGSAQEYYGVTPDLTTLAKAIGGGFPIAALIGKKEIMSYLNPLGPVVMSGTYTGSLMPVLASIQCLQMVREPDFYNHIDALGNALYSGFNDLFSKHGIPGHVRGAGARFGIYFGVENPEDDYSWRKVKASFDAEINKRFIAKTLENGLYFHDYGTSPVPAHNGFGAQHTMQDINFTLERVDKIFNEIK